MSRQAVPTQTFGRSSGRWQRTLATETQAIVVEKVTAHATQRMVDDGAIDEIDKYGNDLAHDAAKKGAAMHLSIAATAAKIKVSRQVAGEAVRWLGVGLESAQKCGAMPAELTQAQKRDRPQLLPRKHIEVVRDQAWRSDKLEANFASGAHSSHSLHKLGDIFFCAVCGCYGAQKLVSLASPCERSATPSRRYLLKTDARWLPSAHWRVSGRHRAGDCLDDLTAHCHKAPKPQRLVAASRVFFVQATWGVAGVC